MIKLEDRLILIVEKFKETLNTFSACDECPIRHTCSDNGNDNGDYICTLLDKIMDELDK